MDNAITFTPSELMGFITTICACCAGIATLVGIIIKIVMRMKRPEIEQNERIKALEDEVKGLKEQNKLFTQYFINDDRRFKGIEKSERITQGAILALLKHALNGNNTKQLEDTTAELEAYLIAK